MEPLLRLNQIRDLEDLAPLDLIRRMQELGLMPRSANCAKCGTPMEIRDFQRAPDKLTWRCRKCRATKSVRAGTWFSRSHLSIVKILSLTYMWSLRYPQFIVQHELQVDCHTTVDWYNFCREVCAEIVRDRKELLGGPGKTVEVDESRFGERRDRQGEGIWVFGGVERGSNRCVLVEVEDRSTETLVALVKEHVAPGSTIVSDCWKSYDGLKDEGFVHLRVNNLLRFKDPESDACTNTIKGLWSCVKRRLPEGNRCKNMFSSYLAEFMWRRLRREADNVFMAFLGDVAKVHPPGAFDLRATDKEEPDEREEPASGFEDL